jgi:hypothetical protein
MRRFLVVYEVRRWNKRGSIPLFKFVCKLHFHWKFNIGNYEKSFRMKWLFYIGIKGGGR